MLMVRFGAGEEGEPRKERKNEKEKEGKTQLLKPKTREMKEKK